MFKYYLLKVLRNKIYLFWCLVFPLGIMACMNAAFGNIYNIENSIDPVKTIVVAESDSAYAEGFCDLVDEFADESAETKYFDMVEADGREDAMEILKDGGAEVLFVAGDSDIEVCLSESHTETAGMVAKTVADTYRSNFKLISEAYMTSPEKAQEMIENLASRKTFTEVDMGAFSDDPNPYVWYFYSTLVMGLFFTAMSGVNLVGDLKADVSEEAARLSLSPSSKSKMIWYAFIARLIPSVLISVIHLAFMRLVFQISLGSNVFRLILFVVVCNIFAISFGVICGLLFKGSVDIRGNKTTGVLMVSVFLSGEMVMQLPGIIEQYCPIVNDINPATVMNMAFYRMALYNDPFDFYMNMVKLVIAAVVFLTIGVLVLRREKYASV